MPTHHPACRSEESPQRRQGVHFGSQPGARGVARYAFAPHPLRLTSNLRSRSARLYSGSPLRSNRLAALILRATPYLLLPHPPPCCRYGCIIARLAVERSGVAALPPIGVRPAGVPCVVSCPALRSGHDTTQDTLACCVRYASAPPPPIAKGAHIALDYLYCSPYYTLQQRMINILDGLEYYTILTPCADCEGGCLPPSPSPRVFFMVLFFLGCLGLFLCSLHRCRAVIARIRVNYRPFGGGRLLPLWLSLCIPLRGVGFIIALRFSSPHFSCVVALCAPRRVGACAPAPRSIINVPFCKVSVKLADVTPNPMLIEVTFALIDAFRALLFRSYVIFSHDSLI